jgi:CRP-like cAMP-binding protein
LECPASIWSLLNGAPLCIDFNEGEIVFRQPAICLGLYIVLSAQFLRRTQRLERRLTLGTVRPGALVELAAVLGDGHHTYTLSAQTSGAVLLLPIRALNPAFDGYPRLRMRLLEEPAYEVSRGYETGCLTRKEWTRRGSA